MKKLIAISLLSLTLVLTAFSEINAFGYNAPIETQEFKDSLREIKNKTVKVISLCEDIEKSVSGTGWMVEDGYVLTNAHVSKSKKCLGSSTVSLEFYSTPGERFGAEVIATDKVADIALLKYKDNPKIKKNGSFKLSESFPQIGDKLLSIGNPEGLFFAHTEGEYQREAYTIWNVPETITINVMALNMKSMPGNSGGPIVNTKGEIVGMMRGYFNDTGFGVAVKLSDIISFLDNNLPKKPEVINAIVAEVLNSEE